MRLHSNGRDTRATTGYLGVWTARIIHTSPRELRWRGEVAQVSNLLYPGFQPAACRNSVAVTMPNATQAGSPAIQLIGNPRYRSSKYLGWFSWAIQPFKGPKNIARMRFPANNQITAARAM